MILKKFLKFEKSSLDDSYKKDSYKKKVCIPHGLPLGSQTHGGVKICIIDGRG